MHEKQLWQGIGKLGSLLSVGFFAFLTFAQEPKVILESLQGSETLWVSKAQSQREIRPGSEIKVGEKIKTGPHFSAVIRYSDGSQIILTPHSDFTLEEQTHETQWNRLRAGKVRGIITKTKIPSSSKPKFMIRNKAAVLGVRGTDFVMSITPGAQGTQIHTLEGSVEVAQNEVALFNGKGTLVPEGQTVESTPKGISQPHSFDQNQFLESFNNTLTHSSETTDSRSLTEARVDVPMATRFTKSEIASEEPTSLPAAKNFPAPEQKEPDTPEIKKNESNPNFKEEDQKRFYLLSFQTGFFYTHLPDETIIRAGTGLWTPRLVLPLLPFFSIHGSFGGHIAPNGSLNNHFLILEYQLFLTLSLFNSAFIEGGLGEQIWKGDQKYDGGLATLNAGLLVHLDFIDRIFVGYQTPNFNPMMNQFKAGIEIHF